MNYNDIILTENGDIKIFGNDIMFCNNLVQAVKVRLRWYKNEWRYHKDLGVDYIGILGEKSNVSLVESAVAEELLKIPEIAEITGISSESNNRTVKVQFSAKLTDGTVIDDAVVIGG